MTEEMAMKAACWECGNMVKDRILYACPVCGGTLLHRYEQNVGQLRDDSGQGVWRYHSLLPTVPEASRLYLGEGQTPLISSRFLYRQLGGAELYFKYEGGNPTGSYKDRIAAVGLSWALANRRVACIGTTSGNAGAAVAAYAARAGIPYHLYVLEHMAEAKLAQVLAYGANVRKVAGFGTDPAVGDRVFHHILTSSVQYGWEMMITAFRYNPYAMEGVKTISYELKEQLGEIPSRVFVPTGGAGLFVGIWKGFAELKERGLTWKVPEIVAVQSEGCSNIAKAFESGKPVPVHGASTSLISGLQVPNPPDGALSLGIMARGDGSALAVSDEEIWEAQQLLAEKEGLLVEPAGAASVAGLLRAARRQPFGPGERIVCILSGSGLKDGKQLESMVKGREVPLLQSDTLNG